MRLPKVIIIIALIFPLGFVGCYSEATEQPSYNPNPTPIEEYLINWELGEEILPYPYFGKWFDCDDIVMYSFLYLKAMNRDLDIKICKGVYLPHPRSQHVWLLVSDNATTLVYDYGIPIQNIWLYKGREISYGQLIYYMEDDL